jgi:uracil-DNA glycosylase family 4
MLSFDPACRQCPRLVQYLEQGRRKYPTYHCGPVAPFGDAEARLIIVGLAPGFHGANASGRPFTGDHAGLLLYRTLHKFGFANRPESQAVGDGLELIDARITNAVKCVPPENKPTTAEIRTCSRFLSNELKALTAPTVLLALGAIAHESVLRIFGLKPLQYRFAHGAEHRLPEGHWLIDSYHCSRYNTQTRRLTEDMFEAVFRQAKAKMESLAAS